LGTFLLGTNGRSYFSFLDSHVTNKTDAVWTADLGAALGHYSKGSGVYQRVFAAGRILVNPSGVSHTVKLPRPYVTQGGTTVKAVTLVPYSAAILTLP
jgi:hypothetical protein